MTRKIWQLVTLKNNFCKIRSWRIVEFWGFLSSIAFSGKRCEKGKIHANGHASF